jgi:hypothetical protein
MFAASAPHDFNRAKTRKSPGEPRLATSLEEWSG